MAVARQGQPIQKRLGDVEFRVGDVLLLQGAQDNIEEHAASLHLLPLAEREVRVGIFSKITIAVAIFVTAILLSMFKIMPTTLSFLGAILAYVFLGILPLRDLYREIDWPVIVLLGAMIPVSGALQSTGLTGEIATAVNNLTESMPAWSIVALLMVVTMCLSDVINNAATALIMAPIGGHCPANGGEPGSVPHGRGRGSIRAFLTPIGHQCNALILGPGGYRFGDYWRMGLPLEILIVIGSVPLILKFSRSKLSWLTNLTCEGGWVGVFSGVVMIHVMRDGQQFGPYTIEDINAYLAQGTLLPTDQAWYEGAANWMPITEVPGVVHGAAPVPAAPAVAGADPMAAANPEVAVAEAGAAVAAVEGAKKKKLLIIAGSVAGVAAIAGVLLFVYPGF